MTQYYRLLTDLGVFDFKDAIGEVESLFERYGEGYSSDEVDVAKDLVYLAAAESSLTPVVETPEPGIFPSPEPWPVPASAARFAVAKGICTFTMPKHLVRPPDELGLWDVALYAGDMIKIALDVGVAPREVAKDLSGLVERLEARHRESGQGYAVALADSGLFRAQGLIWRVRMDLLLGGDRDIAANLAEYMRNVGWGQAVR
jgi:hypothetical protein